MPIYEYRCKQCGVVSDFLQKFSDEPKTQCPSCDQDALEKIVSATCFQLKGTGWYATDFKDKPNTVQKDKPKETVKDKATDKPANKPQSTADSSAKSE